MPALFSTGSSPEHGRCRALEAVAPPAHGAGVLWTYPHGGSDSASVPFLADARVSELPGPDNRKDVFSRMRRDTEHAEYGGFLSHTRTHTPPEPMLGVSTCNACGPPPGRAPGTARPSPIVMRSRRRSHALAPAGLAFPWPLPPPT